MNLTELPPLHVAAASPSSVTTTSTAAPRTPDSQWVATPMDAVPFILIGILIGVGLGKVLGRREAIRKLTAVLKGGGKHQ